MGLQQALALLCPVVILGSGLVASPARADELYQFLRGPLYQPPASWTEFSDAVNKQQAQASSVQILRLEQEMLEPGIITRDIPTPFGTSLRSEPGYYQAVGVEQVR